MPACCSHALLARLVIPLTLLVALVACSPPPPPVAVALDSGGCADRYDPETDYFPDHVAFAHATGVSVSYTNTTKLVEVGRPWKDADETFRALLVQCGTPVPDDVEADVTIEVPVRRVATFSTTQLPAFALLDQVDAIVAHGGLQYAATPEIVERAKAGAIAELGDQTEPDLEALLEVEPQLALLSAGIDGDAHRAAIAAVGIPALPYADWLEETMLGRAEWLKVVGLLTNTERQATAEFAQIERAYRATIARAEEMTRRPKVVLSAPFEGTWYMPAGDSYVAAALTAMGADYPWADTPGTGALSLDIEAVIDRAADADVWIGAGSVRSTRKDLRAIDDRFGVFRPLRRGAVYAEDRQVNSAGGNALFELGAVRPDLVAADLFKMLYPARAQDVAFTFYGRVGSLRAAAGP